MDADLKKVHVIFFYRLCIQGWGQIIGYDYVLLNIHFSALLAITRETTLIITVFRNTQNLILLGQNTEKLKKRCCVVYVFKHIK